jgi:hypothetical protein
VCSSCGECVCEGGAAGGDSGDVTNSNDCRIDRDGRSDFKCGLV